MFFSLINFNKAAYYFRLYDCLNYDNQFKLKVNSINDK